jgi:hypothetical protein
MRHLFFWDVRQRRLVVSHLRFGTIHRSHLQRSCSPSKPYLDGRDRLSRNFGNKSSVKVYCWKIRSIGFPETSVIIQRSSLTLEGETDRLALNVVD